MTTTETCRHETCSCAVPEHAEYCSDYCRDHADEPDLVCECGHPDCEAVSTEMLDEPRTGTG